MINRFLRMSTAFIMSLAGGCQVTDDIPLVISSFEVIGSDNNNTTLPVIDPYIENGRFLLTTATSKPAGGFSLSFFLSGTDSLSQAAFMTRLSCQPSNSTCYDREFITLACNLATDLTGNCSGAEFDVSSKIGSLPLTGYLIVEMCYLTGSGCIQKSSRVLLR